METSRRQIVASVTVRFSGSSSLFAPVGTSVVCLRYNPGGMNEAELDALNRELLLRLQESGIAVPSGTTLRGRYALRAAFCNHRTEMQDLGILITAVRNIGTAPRDMATPEGS